jgi:hypothetical protein
MLIQVVSMVFHVAVFWSEMTLNYHVIMEGYLFSSGVVGSTIPTVKPSLYLT